MSRLGVSRVLVFGSSCARCFSGAMPLMGLTPEELVLDEKEQADVRSAISQVDFAFGIGGHMCEITAEQVSAALRALALSRLSRARVHAASPSPG